LLKLNCFAELRLPYRRPSLFAVFLSAVSLIRGQWKYTKIQNSRTFPRLFAIFYSFWQWIQLKIPIFGMYSAPSLFAVSEFAVFRRNVSTANYEGRLYSFVATFYFCHFKAYVRASIFWSSFCDKNFKSIL
jgi:hypothetical protein